MVDVDIDNINKKMKIKTNIFSYHLQLLFIVKLKEVQINYWFDNHLKCNDIEIKGLNC